MDFLAFKKKLSQRAKQLSYEQRVALGLDLCNRLFPDYRTFAHASGWGNPDVLLDAIRFVASGSRDPQAISRHTDAIEEVTPDTEDFGGADYALSACCALIALLQQVEEPEDRESFEEIALAYYDTIDGRIQEQADDEPDEQLLARHPLLLEACRILFEA
ncbi:DUF416 family protein [Paraflavisolibacter sp. H34]|uniref:DUF416 family protein n=1 Tax=Huijunlia imazamoxiresistens TaxID=3127457 RepID=UPI00301A6190